jgi:hypothetical protein
LDQVYPQPAAGRIQAGLSSCCEPSKPSKGLCPAQEWGVKPSFHGMANCHGPLPTGLQPSIICHWDGLPTHPLQTGVVSCQITWSCLERRNPFQIYGENLRDCFFLGLIQCVTVLVVRMRITSIAFIIAQWLLVRRNQSGTCTVVTC